MVAIGREVAGGYSCSLGQPRRKSLQDSEGRAHRHVLHLTERTLQRQFGAKSAAAWVQECLGTSRRSRCVAQCGFAARFKTEGGIAKKTSGAMDSITGLGRLFWVPTAGGRWRIEWPRTN